MNNFCFWKKINKSTNVPFLAPLIIATLFFQTLSFSSATNSLPLEGKKIVFIIASKQFQEDELNIPKTFLEEKGAEVYIASSQKESVVGMNKTSIIPDMQHDKLNSIEYDAILFIGGSGAYEYFNDPVAHRIAQAAVQEGKILGAICIAPMILANAGILETKRATIWNGMAGELSSKCNIYTGKDVEVDGNIITANGPASALNFAEAIFKKLSYE